MVFQFEYRFLRSPFIYIQQLKRAAAVLFPPLQENVEHFFPSFNLYLCQNPVNTQSMHANLTCSLQQAKRCRHYSVLSLFHFWLTGETTSIATEYSLEFDESMTEDEIEERSFRSLLPSEALRRGTLEKRPRYHEESEDDATDHNSMSVSGAQSILKV